MTTRVGAASPSRAPGRRSPHLVAGRGVAVLTVVLLAAGALSVAASIGIGAVAVPLERVWAVLVAHLLPGGGPVDVVDDQIVWQLRAPRAVLALLVGAGLAVAGTALQALVRNPLADPYVLGVASGASLGAVAVLALGAGALAGAGLATGAFAGAMLAMLAVFAMARRGGSHPPGRLILAGVAVGYAASSATSFLQFQVQPSQLRGIVFWLLGSVAGAEWRQLPAPAIGVALTTAVLLTQGRALNALTLGQDAATALGFDVRRLRLLLMVTTSVLVGAVVSVAGGIGFVGLVVPHVVRLLVGPDHRRVLPLSALLGAVFLVWVDVVARVVSAPAELPIGIFTAAIGTPFFVWLLRRAQRVEGGA